MITINREARSGDAALRALLDPPTGVPEQLTLQGKTRDVLVVQTLMSQLTAELFRHAAESSSDSRWAYVEWSGYEDEDYDADDPAFEMTLLVEPRSGMQDLPWPDDWFAGRRRAECVPGIDLGRITPAKLGVVAQLTPYAWDLSFDATERWTFIPFASPQRGAELVTAILWHAVVHLGLTVLKVSASSEQTDALDKIIARC
jgi:hypothetical protein